MSNTGQLAEQPPFVWFNRVGLPPLGWLFLLGAVLVAALQVELALRGSVDPAPTLLSLLSGTGLTVRTLLPAALLWRVPAVQRINPLLLAGLAIIALGVVARVASQALRVDATVLRVVWDTSLVAETAALLLVGLGLLRLRHGRTTRPWLLVLLAAVYLAALLVDVTRPGVVLDPLGVGRVVVATVLLAFVGWVPLAAWLDRQTPRAFWALLSLAVPLELFRLGVGQAAWLLSREQLVELSGVIGLVLSGVGAIVVLAALVAYGKYTPR